MKAQRKDSGAIALAVVAPILAAVIGGAAAIGAAVQIVHSASSNSHPGPAAVQSNNSNVQYGDSNR
jgi:hypothetical protein